MKAKSLKGTLALLSLVGVMLFIAACTGNDSPQGPSQSGNGAPSSTASQVNRDGILVFGGSGWAGMFNSIMSNNIYDSMVNDLVFEGLVTNNLAGEPIPLLATWEISDDNLSYTFSIDPRAAFSDGRPLTAHDVSFTFHTMAHPDYEGPRTNHVQDLVGFEAFNVGEADHISGIRVLDDHTIVFDHVVASPQHIWNFGFGILCREYYAFDNWDQFMALIDRPFGSGQFVLVDHVFQQWIEFERNENYWNTDREINLAGIVMREVPTESIVPAAVAGEIHVGEAASTLDNLTALQNAEHINENLFVANTLRHITFNTRRPQLEDHRVRQALAYAFNTEAYIIADTGSPDLRAVGNSPFSPVSWAFPGVDALNNYDFNMEKAHELMDEAGWLMEADGFRYKDGERMTLHWLIYPEAAWPGIVTGMAYHSWGELGVELNIEMFDFATVSSMTTGMAPDEKQFDVFQMGWSMAIDPDLRGGLWDGSDAQNVAGTFFNSGFRDQRLMDLIELGATTMDQAKRTEIYHEIAAITNYYLPVWVLSNGTSLWAFGDNVHNLENGAFLRWTQAITQQGTWID